VQHLLKAGGRSVGQARAGTVRGGPHWFRRIGAAMLKPLLIAAMLCLPLAAGAAADSPGPSYGPELQGFTYPYPVQVFAFTSQRQKLRMAYMDLQPAHPNGRTVVLLHGKNFCAATWGATMAALADASYRVIAIDQIGFCKSSKPADYQYSFQQLAGNTRDLLHALGIERAIVMGHSTGGMLGIRYALLYPETVERLVLVSPIGLEDWKAKGVPWHSIDAWFDQERKTTVESARKYQQQTYYAGPWKPEYEKWVEMYAGMFTAPGHGAVAWASAQLYDMIYTQPVVYELDRIKVPVLLMIGDKDKTAIGKDFSPPDVQVKLGHTPELARDAVKRIPQAKLVEFPDLSHALFIEAPERFQKELLSDLAPLP
jgi:pimeloyl-ACP methyl ester carboxylesterase